MQQCVVVLACVDSCKSCVFDSCQGKHHCESRMPKTVEARKRSKIDVVVLESLVDGSWKGADWVKGNSDDISFQFQNGIGKRFFRRESP